MDKTRIRGMIALNRFLAPFAALISVLEKHLAKFQNTSQFGQFDQVALFLKENCTTSVVMGQAGRLDSNLTRLDPYWLDSLITSGLRLLSQPT